MKRILIRALCATLCVALFIGTFSTLLSAADAAAPEPDEIVLAVDEDAAVERVDDDVTVDVDVIVPPSSGSTNIFRGAFDWFFHTFGFLGFILDPYQFTIINQKPVFQFFLGFNDFYDMFTWIVNVWADTVKCEFTYGGKDWRIQLWKGGYGLFLATGGEIGIYTKPEGTTLQHYNASTSQEDWLYLKYSIYNRGKLLYTRPSPYLTQDEGPYWWAPGYRILSICSDFLSSPRRNVVMDAAIQFKSAEMANAFIGSIKAKGFSELTSGSLGLSTPEQYRVSKDGKTVQFIWQNLNEGRF